MGDPVIAMHPASETVIHLVILIDMFNYIPSQNQIHCCRLVIEARPHEGVVIDVGHSDHHFVILT